MRVLELTEQPIHRIPFLNAAKGGGVESQQLPILAGRVDTLPEGLDALLVASDLQGVVRAGSDKTTRLLGEELADVYLKLAAQGSVPAPERTGVLLAGDLYAAPNGDKRGASGDVRSVWEAFARSFRWVAGVEGNHDRFGTDAEKATLLSQPNLHLIDYGTIALETLSIGGVSGIMGDPAKPGRRDTKEFLAALAITLEAQPDLLLLHQGPTGAAAQLGDEQVTELMGRYGSMLTVCGHVHWEQPLAVLNPSMQVLNVDCRAIVLTR
jgi:3',5'-cyclic-AMP phosphodiesterase